MAADDGVRLSVEEVDPVTPGAKAELTVVLVHGFALDRKCWHFQRRMLSELTEPAVRTVLYDQRRHGRSGQASARSCTIAQLGADLDAILRSVVPEGPIVLVGHSMGGMTIMALAERNPKLFKERVAGVALVCTSAGDVMAGGLSRPCCRTGTRRSTCWDGWRTGSPPSPTACDGPPATSSGRSCRACRSATAPPTRRW